jgi:hypothetical protein
MEKQQIIDARIKGDYFCDITKAEQYYNDTFKEIEIMTPINTKFKPNDKVYAIQGNKIKLWEVVKMLIEVNSKNECKARYCLESNDCSSFNTEDDSILFKSKDDLINYMSS